VLSIASSITRTDFFSHLSHPGETSDSSWVFVHIRSSSTSCLYSISNCFFRVSTSTSRFSNWYSSTIFSKPSFSTCCFGKSTSTVFCDKALKPIRIFNTKLKFYSGVQFCNKLSENRNPFRIQSKYRLAFQTLNLYLALFKKISPQLFISFFSRLI
jgi:hypothetical protein